MKHTTAIVLACFLLGGLNSASGEDVTAGPIYEQWKSCVEHYHPNGATAVSDLRASISQPTSIRELLQNLQLVWKQDLLLQPAFYDPATLRKLFAASAVSSGEPSHSLPAMMGFVVAQLDSGALPGVSVRAESRCWFNQYRDASGQVKLTASMMGVLTLSDKAFAGMDLRTIRAVFGPETVNAIDVPFYTHGVVSQPIGKGHVAYVDQAREKTEVLAQRITFFFEPNDSQHTHEVLTKIVDEDVVRQIEIRVSRDLPPE
jgi:hypothetical protein